MQNCPTRSAIPVKISSLKVHPDQENLFYPKPDVIAALAADIQTNDLQHPIRILPDGTIVEGHKRVAAHALLGRTTIMAVVDEELALKGKKAVREQLIKDNLVRTHLSPLEKAKCVVALLGGIKELRGEPSQRVFSKDMKREVGKMLGITGRSVDRLLQLLRLPEAVQIAVDRELITEKLARDIEGRSVEVQLHVAELVEGYLANDDGDKQALKQLKQRIIERVNEATPAHRQAWSGEDVLRHLVRTVEEERRFPGRLAGYLREHPEHLVIARRMALMLRKAVDKVESERINEAA